MSEENKQKAAPKNNSAKRPANRPGQRSGQGRGPKGGRGEGRGPKTFAERAKPEFEQKIIDIRRVTRVVAGGRRMSFAVALAIGDGKGSVGLGTGKGADTAIAINKDR